MPDSLVEFAAPDRQQLVHLFQGNLVGYMPDAVLEGHMGRAWGDSATPSFAVLEIPEIRLCALGGDVTHPAALRYLTQLPRFTMVVIGADKFAAVAQSVHPHQWVVLERYAFSSATLSLDNLRQLKRQIPAGFRVKQIDLTLAKQLQAKPNRFAAEHGCTFASPTDFVNRGFGYCVLDDDRIACVASSFFICDKGIEIQIDTHRDYRGQGLATVAAAHLIVHSLAQGLDPGWDAANATSAKLARKLGYRPTATYHMYVYTGSRILVGLRAIAQVIRKRILKK